MSKRVLMIFLLLFFLAFSSVFYLLLDVYDLEAKTQFYLTIEGSTLLLLLLLYAILHFYTSECEKKDYALTKYSQYVALGEIGELIVNNWREPLSHIATRVETILLDYEFEKVYSDKHNESLIRVKHTVEDLSESLEGFKKVYGQKRIVTSVDICDIIDKAIDLLHNESVLNNIVYQKYYNFKDLIKLKENTAYLIVIQVIVSLIELIKLHKQKGGVISVSVVKSGLLKIHFKVDVLLTEDEQYNLFKSPSAYLNVTRYLVQKELNGDIDVKSTKESTEIVVSMPEEIIRS